MDIPDKRSLPPYAIESVDKALRLLLLLRDRGEVRVTDVSAELGVARSTAHRLLMTLAHHGFVAQDRVSRVYRVGRVLYEIGLSAAGELDIRRKARLHMELLAAELRETVNLLVLEGSGCRFVDGVEGDRQIRVTSRTGTLLPAHATSGGKLLLAELARDEVDARFPDGLTSVTDRTITALSDLHAELDDIRSQGYAVNRGESEPDLFAVAVCVRDHSQRAVAALAVSVPALRVNDAQLEALLGPLRSTSEAIGNDL
jgi:DNA-binding IclR family transcriptional regulator